MTKALISALFLTIVAFASINAQPKYFTGTIDYKITYPSGTAGPLAASLPSNLSMQIAGNKCKFELTLPNGKQTFIVNGDEISVIRLMDMAEGKFYLKKTREDFQQKDQPTVTALKDTKTVAGYKCKGAEISVTDRGGRVQKSTAFFSEELGNNNIYFNTMAKGIKGLLLDFDYNGLGVPMHLTATTVNSQRISNKTFEIPAGYTETTEAKIQQMKQARKNK